MKRWWNSFKIAFSMYSKIPMPKSDWTPENMRYVMCFFPLIGIAIGAAIQVWLRVALKFEFGSIFLVLIPVFLTGGIHLDGLLDTADAMSSYQEKERRLEILKDSRSGAFAVITCTVYFLLYVGVCNRILPMTGEKEAKLWMVLCLGFVLSRAFSGFGIVTLKLAKNTGLAATFSDNAQKKTTRIVMLVYIAVTIILMILVQPIYGLVCSVAAFLTFLYYRHMSYKNFGGITGDLAGWFLQICELMMALVGMLVYVLL